MKKIFAIMLVLQLCGSLLAQSMHSVKGTVKDESGQTVIGAAVLVDGGKEGTVTDSQGHYSIKAKDDDVLVFTCMGFKEVRQTVSGRGLIDVTLATDTNVLDDVVVIAYGTEKKSDLTGSVATLNMKDLDTPMQSVDQVLQGRVAGMEVTTTSGEPGASASIQIRGSRSISASNEPLIVVDGVMDAVSDLNEINPSDIKSLSVLKDVSSTAIYGARGANGVIIVTTKDGGEAGKLSINFKADVGVSSLLRSMDIMDASEFARYRNDAIYNRTIYNGGSGAAAMVVEPQTAGSRYPFPSTDLGKGTDWVKALSQNALTQNYNLSLQMSKGKSKTYVGVGYNDTQGIIIGTGKKRFNTSLRFSTQLFKKLTAGINVNFTLSDTDRNKVQLNGYSSTAAVCLSPLLDIDSTWNKYGDTSGGSVFNNPYLIATRETNKLDMTYFSINPRLEWAINRYFSLKTNFSYNLKNTRTFFYSPSNMPKALYNVTGGSANASSNRRDNFLWETTASYKQTFKKAHKVDALVGFTTQQTTDEYMYMSGNGYLDDNVTYHNMGSQLDSRNISQTTTYKKITRMSVIGRANYSYKSRYFLTLTGRADGSSNFSEGNKWAFFPAGAFKWTLSNEKFLKNSRRWLKDLSIRLSAGRSGNDAVPSYLSQAALTSSSSGWYFRDNREIAYYPTRLDNPTLTWEKTDSFNAGIDFDILDHRFIFTLDAYIARTTDLLLNVKNAAVTGFTSRYNNVGSTRNSGVEFSFTSKNISTRNFLWSTAFTISHNDQMVTDTGAGNEYIATYSIGSQMVYGYVKGYPANSLWGYQYGGVWHNQDELDRNAATRTYAGFKSKTGYAKYVDVNHDGILNKEDWVYLGCADPLAYGGFENRFTFWNKLTVTAYISYSIGGKVYNLSEMYLGSGSIGTNAYRYMLNAWHPVRNPDSDIPAAYVKDSFANSRYVYDASFLRFKTLNISYRFDFKKVKWIKSLTLGLNCDNLFLISDYPGFDPDVASTSKRLDDNAYPYPRTFTGSVSIKF